MFWFEPVVGYNVICMYVCDSYDLSSSLIIVLFVVLAVIIMLLSL